MRSRATPIIALLLFVQANKEDLRTSNLKPVGYTFLGVLSFVPSIYVGLLIDRMNNAPVYERRFQASRITLGPIVGDRRRASGRA
jgi:hypothetical protein